MNQSPLAASPRTPHTVVMVGFEDAQILDITGPLEVFARTSRWLREHARLAIDAYTVELVADEAGPLRTSGGLLLIASRAYRDVSDAQTLLVAGGIGYREAARDSELLEWLRRQLTRVQRLGSICTGAFVLAEAGLLHKRNATTHWAYCDRLASTEPTATVASDCLYTRSGKVYTSAGVTAGMDLALAMVESDWGREVALAVAQELVLFAKRSGAQAQISRELVAQKKAGRSHRRARALDPRAPRRRSQRRQPREARGHERAPAHAPFLGEHRRDACALRPATPARGRAPRHRGVQPPAQGDRTPRRLPLGSEHASRIRAQLRIHAGDLARPSGAETAPGPSRLTPTPSPMRPAGAMRAGEAASRLEAAPTARIRPQC
jgi:transcriptional regulator GlxA family with amidase domain